MSLTSAVIMFLMLSYLGGFAVGGVSLYFGTQLISFMAGTIGVIVLLVIHRIELNSLRMFFESSINYEANRIVYEHSEEAMTLLAKGDYENLKIHLIGKSSEAEDVVRKLKLEFDGPPVSVE